MLHGVLECAGLPCLHTLAQLASTRSDAARPVRTAVVPSPSHATRPRPYPMTGTFTWTAPAGVTAVSQGSPLEWAPAPPAAEAAVQRAARTRARALAPCPSCPLPMLTAPAPARSLAGVCGLHRRRWRSQRHFWSRCVRRRRRRPGLPKQHCGEAPLLATLPSTHAAPPPGVPHVTCRMNCAGLLGWPAGERLALLLPPRWAACAPPLARRHSTALPCPLLARR